MKEITSFKGGRNYIHATDELAAGEALIKDGDNFTFTARRVGVCVARWFEAEEDLSEGWEPIARLVVNKEEEGRRVYECRQDLERPISDVVGFDEDMLMKSAILEGETLTCITSGDFTLWEYLSSLQKMLLQKVIGHQQWYFVRLVLGVNRFIKTSEMPLKLVLRYSQQKGPLFISEILFGSEVVGEIAFSKR